MPIPVDVHKPFCAQARLSQQSVTTVCLQTGSCIACPTPPRSAKSASVRVKSVTRPSPPNRCKDGTPTAPTQHTHHHHHPQSDPHLPRHRYVAAAIISSHHGPMRSFKTPSPAGVWSTRDSCGWGNGHAATYNPRSTPGQKTRHADCRVLQNTIACHLPLCSSHQQANTNGAACSIPCTTPPCQSVAGTVTVQTHGKKTQNKTRSANTSCSADIRTAC